MPTHPNDFASSTTPAKGDGTEGSLRKINRLLDQMTGTGGAKFVSNTSAATPTAPNDYFKAIVVIEEAVLAAIASNIEDDDDLVGVVLPASTTIFGRITSVTLTSGSVLAYYE